jgi:hypothetical protein
VKPKPDETLRNTDSKTPESSSRVKPGSASPTNKLRNPFATLEAPTDHIWNNSARIFAPAGVVYSAHLESCFNTIVCYLKRNDPDFIPLIMNKLELGESRFAPESPIRVDLRGFLLTLLKVAVLRSIDTVYELVSQMLNVDIPALRSKILEEKHLYNQQSCTRMEEVRPIVQLDQEFLTCLVFADDKVHRVLNIHAMGLLQAFN